MSVKRAMDGLAAFRIVLGAASWLAPDAVVRVYGVPKERRTDELAYMTRVFGVRAVSLGVGYLASSGEARALWHRLWLLCDTADTAMGVSMLRQGRLRGATAVGGLVTTAGAAVIDVAALGDR